jgi:hypothetical protein
VLVVVDPVDGTGKLLDKQPSTIAPHAFCQMVLRTGATGDAASDSEGVVTRVRVCVCDSVTVSATDLCKSLAHPVAARHPNWRVDSVGSGAKGACAALQKGGDVLAAS